MIIEEGDTSALRLFYSISNDDALFEQFKKGLSHKRN